MSTKDRNYRTLTESLYDVFDDVMEDSIALEKANALVGTANAITSIQRAKIASTRVTGAQRLRFFED